MRIHLLLCALASGCIGLPPEIDDAESAHTPHFRPGEEGQGVDLRGDWQILEGIRTTGAWDSKGRAFTSLRVEKGELIGTQKSLFATITVRGTALKGTRLQGWRGSTTYDIKIDNVWANPVDPLTDHILDTANSTYGYDLSYITKYGLPPDTDHTWAKLCRPDAHGEQWAVPVKGLWGAKADYNPDATSGFTFGCTSSALFKCQAWGYFPWRTAQGNTYKPMTDVYQACIRMARADYCGDGRSMTYNGTAINGWDTLSPSIRRDDNEPSSTMQFESAWRPRGAVCLSHARWANLPPPEGLCGDKTRGPYTPVWGSDDATPVGWNPTICDSPSEALGIGPTSAKALHLTESYISRYPSSQVVIPPILTQ
jgi:hypothetical protein